MIGFDLFKAFFFFQAKDGIRDTNRSRGLGVVYKGQVLSDNIMNNSIKSGSKLNVESLNVAVGVKRIAYRI